MSLDVDDVDDDEIVSLDEGDILFGDYDEDVFVEVCVVCVGVLCFCFVWVLY